MVRPERPRELEARCAPTDPRPREGVLGGTPARRSAAGSPGPRLGRAARDALPPGVFRLKGAPTWLTTTTTTTTTSTKRDRCRPEPPLQSPPPCHLPPPGQCRALRRAALPRACPARGSGRTAGRALWPTFPAATAPPRETRGWPWPLLSRRKGAAAAEDARPDCAAGGPTWARRAAASAAAGPAASFQVPVPPERPGPFSSPPGGAVA